VGATDGGLASLVAREGDLVTGPAVDALRRQLDVPGLAWFRTVGSTMNVAHLMAGAGAPAGAVVLADRQEHGRGRGGHTWSSEAGAGCWCTVIERPLDAAAVEVLSLRVGLRLASVLDRYASSPLQLKWPNDLLLRGGKVGGVLVEARWREQRPEWVAIGIGINFRAPAALPEAASLGAHVDRDTLLAELVPAVRAAAASTGLLTPQELLAFGRRDWARGRLLAQPRPGTAAGVSPAGALLIENADGVVACPSGSLRLAGSEA